MTINASFHDPERAKHNLLSGRQSDVLSFEGEGGEYISLFVPPHVAEHTAAAFNRAMQAVPDRHGWTYATKSGVWHISSQPGFGFFAQHDEVTGDSDPAWMFAEASSLIGCMDAIDDIEDECLCTECNRLFGSLTDFGDDEWLCDDCAEAEAKHQQGLHEMAQDDKAHAAMEKAAGL